MIWIGILLTITSLIIWLCFLKINVSLDYSFIDQKQSLQCTFTVLALRIYTYELPDDRKTASVVKTEPEQSYSQETTKKKTLSLLNLLAVFQKIKEWEGYLLSFHTLIRARFKHIYIHKLKWQTECGVGDAMVTAQTIGYLWTIKSLLVGLLNLYVTFPRLPELQIAPLYRSPGTHTHVQCMFSFRIGHAIRAGLSVLWHWRKRPMAESH
ncbi:DUF2953 domain-containing protein [Alkalicoccobacillus gibsonii]|uniref:DUF2953 domain-containing protein n=1 Tax=Alkalicoccobacillus gibsonii TaxID=79881 RepID=UPI003512AEC2